MKSTKVMRWLRSSNGDIGKHIVVCLVALGVPLTVLLMALLFGTGGAVAVVVGFLSAIWLAVTLLLLLIERASNWGVDLWNNYENFEKGE